VAPHEPPSAGGARSVHRSPYRGAVTVTPEGRRRALAPARTAALVGTLAVAGYVALGLLHVLVLDPLAAAPGRTLDEVHARLAEVGATTTPTVVVLWGVVGLAIAVVLLVAAGRVTGVRVREVVVEYALVLAGGGPSFVAAAAGYRTALVDGLHVDPADQAPTVAVLTAVSAAAFVVVLVAAVASVVGARRTRGTAPE